MREYFDGNTTIRRLSEIYGRPSDAKLKIFQTSRGKWDVECLALIVASLGGK
ncbi:hypothetical protein [Archaeoglobus sulfaticallidus]|uniref:hypothetical protein n=1 Tax=Archaeoglobus sulfaticallidus TaxID=1316941 RepID=UPI00146166DA|nr:hypothetical protein [Archaeoglobus sulfaticallidus]